MYGTLHNMSRASKSARREKSRVTGGVLGACLLKKTKCLKGGGGYLVRDRVCFSLEQLAQAVETAKAVLTLEESSGGVLAGLRREERLGPFARCVRDRMRMDGVGVFDGDVRKMFVKSEFLRGGFCLSLGDYHKALNVIRASCEERCVEYEQRVYVNLELGALRKMLNSFVFTPGRGTGAMKCELRRCCFCFFAQ